MAERLRDGIASDTDDVDAAFAPNSQSLVFASKREGAKQIFLSRGEFVVFMDADGSHNPKHIAKLWPYRNEYDVVVGSRYVDGGTTENPAILIFMSWVVNVTFPPAM